MPDMMHTVAVQVQHLVRCIAGKAPEESLSVRKQEQHLDRFQELWPDTTTALDDGTSKRKKGKGKKKSETGTQAPLKTAQFGLTKKEMEEDDNRSKEISPRKTQVSPRSHLLSDIEI